MAIFTYFTVYIFMSDVTVLIAKHAELSLGKIYLVCFLI
jgi:hypothetical protein